MGKFAAALRGFGPIGILAIALILYCATAWFSALLILLWVCLSRTRWREIGLVRPASWPRTIVIGVFFGVSLKLLMKTVVMPLLGAPPTNQAFQFLIGNTAYLPQWLLYVIFSAGVGEELFYRGYLFERLGKLFGTSKPAVIATILITTAAFAAVHYSSQHLPGVEQAFVAGLVFASTFALTRQLPVLMIAHASFDITATLIIYYGAETRFAHVFFR